MYNKLSAKGKEVTRWLKVKKDMKNNCVTKTVLNLDTGTKYIFTARTAYEAMEKMIYTLNISEKCNTDIEINKYGNTLYFIYKDNTYASIII